MLNHTSPNCNVVVAPASQQQTPMGKKVNITAEYEKARFQTNMHLCSEYCIYIACHMVLFLLGSPN